MTVTVQTAAAEVIEAYLMDSPFDQRKVQARFIARKLAEANLLRIELPWSADDVPADFRELIEREKRTRAERANEASS